ncbi:MAG: bifunctional phosphopantothenoylcysteine decarboxylase/phosphopantothenate--cysteine ligase CoaBC [Bowdeniella nasicola]|nr:bifunctional phosphopantothenoylcysteine decarboxylase/phosphopantothenate--cysteine ligase CoaBC [Bowdeniella nasicola]
MHRASSRPLRIVYGVCGGIAAYKGVHVLRRLREAGHEVHVVATAAALQMVGTATWQALSANPVATDVFAGATTVDHIRLAEEADLVLIAPATANTMAKLAAGIADNLLTATVLATRAPVVLAPAMHTGMWENAATKRNVATLQADGMHVLAPATGRLTGADSGIGRLPEPEAIITYALGVLRAPVADLDGKRIVITAGGTREALDPVRYLANHSSGRQGVALAAAAAGRGARVVLIAANIADSVLCALPPNVEVVPVISAHDLHAAALAHQSAADVIIMAAAVADYRPLETSGVKRKKTGTSLSITLEENPDILRELIATKPAGQTVIGFAAETGDETHTALEYGIAKAQRKGADILCVNAISQTQGFGDKPNYVHLLDHDGELIADGGGTKMETAHVILDTLADRIGTVA